MTTTLEGFPKSRLERAEAELAKAHARLVRAAAKTGQVAPAAPRLEVVKEYILSRCNQCHSTVHGWAGGRCMGCPANGYMVSREVVDLEIVAERPALAGWEFLAVVEPLEGGNLIRQVPGANVADGELAFWRQGHIVCNHCNARRKRIETFIVRSDGSDEGIPAGAYKQVGRNCLAAFLGGKSAAAILAAIGWPAMVRAIGDGEGGLWGGGPGVYEQEEFMMWAAAVVRINGWISKATARASDDKTATADVTQYLLTPPFGSGEAVRLWRKAREDFKPTDDDKLRGLAALAWARELPESSDYERNLRLVACQQALDPKHAGILASALQAHAKALGEELKRQMRDASPSQHVGEVGAKGHEFGAVTLERVFATETQYGPLHIHTFRDATGNAIVWKTNEGKGGPGDVFTMKATVKAHSEFKGEKQTEVSRAKLEKSSAA